MDRSSLGLLERLRLLSDQDDEAHWLERGIDDHKKGRHLRALEAWKRASALGCAEAEYRIGLLYMRGDGVLRSMPDAVAWFRRAGAVGHVDAQFQLGRIYFGGSNTGPSGTDDWIRTTSQQDGESSLKARKALFPNGLTVEKDLNEAMRWISAAASAAHVEAQAILGDMYRRGLGCEQDYARAYQWCSLAAANSVASAQFGMGDIYYQGLGVEVDHQLAADWYDKAARNGDARAQVALAS